MPVRTRSQRSEPSANGNESRSDLQDAPARYENAAWTSATALPTMIKDAGPTGKPTKEKLRKGADIPPVHRINLGLPPEQRYVELALKYRDQVADLVGLFDEVVEAAGVPISVARVKQIARLFLRRVYDNEQTRELRGISKATGVEMYLMVAFNVLLDLFMGCTSGGVRISNNGQNKMLHFRTLDWGMDVLRRVVVQLEFVEREDGPVVARSVTYVGFVGVLTGVRQGLSLSLNFRGLHNNSKSTMANILYVKTLLLVLLGFRPSIASTLRHIILPSTPKHWTLWRNRSKAPILQSLQRSVPSISTTACYLIFSDGKETMTIEKDRIKGLMRKSDTFITATNHDAGHDDEAVRAIHKTPDVTGMAELVEESLMRRGCIEKCFNEAVASGANDSVSLTDVEKWMGTYPVLNECTHYAVIMDPSEGTIRHARRWIKSYKATGAERRAYPWPHDE